MKKIPAAVERTLKKLGIPVKVKWDDRSFAAAGGTTLNTYAVIENREVSVGNGVREPKLVATLARTDRDLDGATMIVGSKSYQVKTYNQTYAGANVAMQEVILT